MKRLISLLVIPILVIGMSLVSCTKDPIGDLDSRRGLPNEVVEIITPEILEEMNRLEMPINMGNTPPVIEGTFSISPFEMIRCNIPDETNCTFYDFKITFRQQEQQVENISPYLEIDLQCGIDYAHNVKAYIIGDNDESFTVFARVDLTKYNGTIATYVYVLSGDISSLDGIDNVHISCFMYDDKGDPTNCLIENNQGRLLRDGDGFSERITVQ